jgi:crotonobetainyl-CoA:carnitine CoA-transferase CaiB-like acyl-CoA transferase
VKHLGMATKMHSPVIGDADVVASAISMTGFSKDIRMATPEQGASTDEVLASVGYSADEIAAMRKKGAI